MDDLRIYSRALSTVEVKALYEGDGEPMVTKCVVTFDAAGGTAEWTKGEVVKGAAVGTLPTAAREGYEFLGWFTAAVGGSQVTAATVVTEDVTFYAQWRKIEETPIATYGPWGEAEAVKNPDKLGPTMLTDMTLELNGAAGAVGDIVAAFRGDTGALCGLGKVMDGSGTLSMVCYAPTGVKLHFKVWVAASGVEKPTVLDCDAMSDLTAPTSGSFLSGHALVVGDDKDLTISLGSVDWHTVSFNVLPEDPSPAAVFGSVQAKIAAVTQGIEFWMPGKASSLKAIEIGKGYWVNTKVDDVEWTVSGKTDPKAEIALEEGWNLVGYAPEAEGAVQAVLKTALAAKAVDYVTYGVEFYPGGTLKTMDPGKAYWVHATKAWKLVYDEAGTQAKAARLLAGAAAGDGGSTGLNAAVPTYGPWGESETVKNPDKLGPTFLTDMEVEIDGEPAAEGDVVAVFRGDTGALCGLGKVMDDSGTLTVVCYAPAGVKLHFKVWVAASGVVEPVVVDCDATSDLTAPTSGAFLSGHTLTVTKTPGGGGGDDPDGPIEYGDEFSGMVGVRFEVELSGLLEGLGLEPRGTCTAKGLPAGIKIDAKKGLLAGVPTKAGTFFATLTDARKRTASLAFTIAPLPEWGIGTFTGYDQSDFGGAATMTVAKNGKISGKIVSGGKTWSFSSASYDQESYEGCLVVSATAKSGKETGEVWLAVCPLGDVEAGGLQSACAEGGLLDSSVTLWRNVWKDKGAAQCAAKLQGLYTASLSGLGSYGYLSIKADSKGGLKATGKLPDGTSISSSMTLVSGDGLGGDFFTVWTMAPSAYKGGGVAGVLFFDDESPRHVNGDGQWSSNSPTATEEYGAGFFEVLEVEGAYYDPGDDLSRYYEMLNLSLEAPNLQVKVKYTEEEWDERDRPRKVSYTEIDSVGPAVDVSGTARVAYGGKLSVPKATKPVRGWEPGEWCYACSPDANPSAMTLSFAKATGIFKGSVTCWYDYISAYDSTKEENGETYAHTSKKVAFEGIWVQGQSLRGFYLQDMTGSYLEEKPNGDEVEKTYKYKQPCAMELY